MEKLPVKTRKAYTPAKSVLAGVFLAVLLGIGGMIMNAGAAPQVPSFPAREDVILQNENGQVAPQSVAGTSTEPEALENTEISSSDSSISSAPAARADLPRTLRIPKLGINSNIQHLGLTAGGDMATPKSAVDVAWYKLGTRPGKVGSAVIAGHVNTSYNPHGVFENLGNLVAGDVVEVVNGDGTVLRFKVTNKKLLGYDASAVEVFGSVGSRRLNLITCTGKWLPEKKTYSERLVVFTELI